MAIKAMATSATGLPAGSIRATQMAVMAPKANASANRRRVIAIGYPYLAKRPADLGPAAAGSPVPPAVAGAFPGGSDPARPPAESSARGRRVCRRVAAYDVGATVHGSVFPAPRVARRSTGGCNASRWHRTIDPARQVAPALGFVRQPFCAPVPEAAALPPPVVA